MKNFAGIQRARVGILCLRNFLTVYIIIYGAGGCGDTNIELPQEIIVQNIDVLTTGPPSDAEIIDIDPPIDETRELWHPRHTNGTLNPKAEPQSIVVVFSEVPQNLTVTNADPLVCECKVSPVTEWVLEGRRLELKAFCSQNSGSTMITLDWHSGTKILRYLCQQ